MNNSEKAKPNPKAVFYKCGACSRAAFHLLNREFGNRKPVEEKASDLLAGGMAMRGRQCGMIWGAALAVGTEAFRRYTDKNTATATAIRASGLMIDSFARRAGTVDCREITGVDWDKKIDRAMYVLKTIVRGFVFSPCFNLFAQWAPEAIAVATKGLSEPPGCIRPCFSCAAEVLTKMGATAEESMMAAGFAGGIGLSGNACGALGAVIWYKMLGWNKQNAGKTPAMFNNPEASKILKVFNAQTGSEILCRKISGKQFATLDQHSEYIESGGCRNLIDVLAE